MIVFLVVSFLASIVGAICGIGGGVVIKPVLDMLRLESVAAISFLSNCTVLSMSCYSVGKAMLGRDGQVDLKTGTPLALGAAVGGLTGRQLFTGIQSLFANQNAVGAVQAACLGVITVGTLFYKLYKSKIKTRGTENQAACLGIGLVLGILSSFLGIGGGPINLVVLHYFFSMDTKKAATNSLYVILFSQLASLGTALATRTVPSFQPFALALMIAGGIGGGIVGRIFNRRIDSRTVDKLFLALMALIILICVYNVFHNLSV